MKKILFLTLIFVLLASCSGKNETISDNDIPDIPTDDSDTASVDDTDSAPVDDADSTSEPSDDDVDTDPTNDADSMPEPSDDDANTEPTDDADSQPEPSDDDADSEPTDDADSQPKPSDDDADTDPTDDADSQPEPSDDDVDTEPTDDTDSQPEPSDDDTDSEPTDDADSGDSQPDDDADTDSGDSQPDDTDTDTTPADPCNPNPCTSISNSTGVCTANGTAYTCGCQSGYTWNGDSCEVPAFPACSSTSSTPCIDSTSSLVWSARASSTYTWANAVSYCDNLTEGGYSDWHLPTIDELRTLLIASRVSANCQVSETNNCLSYSSCFSCSTCTQMGTQPSSGTGTDCLSTSYSDGRYSKFGETGGLWSSSVLSDNSIFAWFVSFSYGHVGYGFMANSDGSVRCVRNAD